MQAKIISWNVNGIRAIQKKGFEKSLNKMDADVFCIQETKAQDDQVREALSEIEDYHIFTNSAVKKGYSGTAILSKKMPVSVFNDIAVPEHDTEGRVITAEYEKFYVICVYVPNSGQELARLEYRQTWDRDFLLFIKNLEKTKPVIICGDFNVAHQPIDLARPKSNYNKTAGYMQQEIDGITNHLNSGLIDTYRMVHPDEVKYSWWSYRFQSRAKNIGWRIDYILVSENISKNIKEAFILNEYTGSDHCPVGAILNL